MKQGATAPDANATATGIVVGDILRWLASQADMQHDARTGNATFAEAIRVFADALKPHRSRSVPDLIEMLASLSTPKIPNHRRKPPVELPSGLTTLTRSAVEQVLADDRYLKSQLAELGFQRFGISRSRLCRLTKIEGVEAIRAALEHERSLDVIGQQARAAGRRQSYGLGATTGPPSP